MTLNQQYKNSGSEKSFKDWVFEQQKNGQIDFDKIDLETKYQTMTYSVAGEEKKNGYIHIWSSSYIYRNWYFGTCWRHICLQKNE